MTTDYHDPWVDNSTNYSAASMNPPLSQLDTQIQNLATSIYDIGGTFEDKPITLETILRFPVPRTINFVIDLVGSQMVAGIAATALAVFSIQKNGTEFATATFAVSGTTATFIAGTATEFVAGDVLTIVSPASPDATLENLGWGLVASRTVLIPI